MFPRRVALVAVESIIGIEAVQLPHQRVPRRLGQDGCRRNFRHQAVAGDDRPRWEPHFGAIQPVHEDFVRFEHQLLHSTAHCEKAGAQYIDTVDLLDRGTGYRPCCRAITDLDGQFFAPLRGECLRIGETVNRVLCAQDDASRENRTGQRPAARLVHAADQQALLQGHHARRPSPAAASRTDTGRAGSSKGRIASTARAAVSCRNERWMPRKHRSSRLRTSLSCN